MRLEVEELEPRCVLSNDLGNMPVLVSDPVAGTIREAESYANLVSSDWLHGPYVASGVPGCDTFSADGRDFWALAPALTQEWSQVFVGVGEWNLGHVHWIADKMLVENISELPEIITLQRFSIPNVVSVGLLLHDDGSVTIYQQTPGTLWSVTTHDAGQVWGRWQQVVSLVRLEPSGQPVLPPFAFDYLVTPNGWAFGEPLPALPPHVVYGTIFASEDEVRIGFEVDGIRYAGIVQDGVLSTELVDEFWSLGEWKPEVEVWGAI